MTRFDYAYVQRGDGEIIRSAHISTFDPERYESNQGRAMALSIMESVLFSDENILRVEFAFDGHRLTLEREGLCHRYNDIGCRIHMYDAFKGSVFTQDDHTDECENQDRPRECHACYNSQPIQSA